MNLKKMSCCMLAIGMIASMNLASFADSTVQAETPLSVEQSASAEQDVKASAYYIDENGNEVPMDVETTVRSLGKTLTRSGEEAERYEVTATVSPRKFDGDSSIVDQGTLFCKATATLHYNVLYSPGYHLEAYAESGTWDYGNNCSVINKYFKLSGAGTKTVYLSDSYDSFYEYTTYSSANTLTYRTYGTVIDSDGYSKQIMVQITV